MRTARKDETGLFAAGDDFNGMSERLFGFGEELGGVGRYAQSLGADGSDVLRRNSLELFAETTQGG